MKFRDVKNKLQKSPKLLSAWENRMNDYAIVDMDNASIKEHRKIVTKELALLADRDSSYMHGLLLAVLDDSAGCSELAWQRNINEFVIPYLQKYVEPLI